MTVPNWIIEYITMYLNDSNEVTSAHLHGHGRALRPTRSRCARSDSAVQVRRDADPARRMRARVKARHRAGLRGLGWMRHCTHRPSRIRSRTHEIVSHGDEKGAAIDASAPDATEIPTCAALSAPQSLAPSPHIPTTCSVLRERA